MWWLIAIAIITGILLFLLFAPITLELNTDAGRCELKWWGIGSMNVVLADDRIRLRMKVAGIRFFIDPFGSTARSARPAREEKQPKRTMTARMAIRKFRSMTRSFRVLTFYCDWDSGDFLINSWLFPVAHLIDPPHRQMNINFTGRRFLVIKIENTVWRLARAWFS